MYKAHKLCAPIFRDGKFKEENVFFFCILLLFGIKIVKYGCIRNDFQSMTLKYRCLLIGRRYYNTVSVY